MALLRAGATRPRAAGVRALGLAAPEAGGRRIHRRHADAAAAKAVRGAGHECSAAARAEVGDALAAWFRERFPSYEIGLLSEREPSRVFAACAELNPHLGLAWLRRAVERASPEELLAFDARTDGSGFWRGRRQVVWLCDHLAQFPEHFWQCEATLYRLGLALPFYSEMAA